MLMNNVYAHKGWKLVQNFDARVHEDHEEETEELSGFAKREIKLSFAVARNGN